MLKRAATAEAGSVNARSRHCLTASASREAPSMKVTRSRKRKSTDMPSDENVQDSATTPASSPSESILVSRS